MLLLDNEHVEGQKFTVFGLSVVFLVIHEVSLNRSNSSQNNTPSCVVTNIKALDFTFAAGSKMTRKNNKGLNFGPHPS